MPKRKISVNRVNTLYNYFTVPSLPTNSEPARDSRTELPNPSTSTEQDKVSTNDVHLQESESNLDSIEVYQDISIKNGEVEDDTKEIKGNSPKRVRLTKSGEELEEVSSGSAIKMIVTAEVHMESHKSEKSTQNYSSQGASTSGITQRETPPTGERRIIRRKLQDIVGGNKTGPITSPSESNIQDRAIKKEQQSEDSQEQDQQNISKDDSRISVTPSDEPTQSGSAQCASTSGITQRETPPTGERRIIRQKLLDIVSGNKTGPITSPSESDKVKEESEKLPVSVDKKWIHCNLEFLKPNQICDSKRRRPDHPDYDPSTVYVPPEFFKKQTPVQKQWWEIKSTNFDGVLFFKVGKFYELFHMDSVIGVNELGLTYIKGEIARSGFPEVSYPKMMSALSRKGYKVVRVEQTETPDMMTKRCKVAGSKMDKVVRREICRVSMRGALVSGVIDPMPSHTRAEYMVAITEEVISRNSSSTFGVCIAETTVSEFRLGQFVDDQHVSRLLTALSHYPPVLILYDRNSTSPSTVKFINSRFASANRISTPMWEAERTLSTLHQNYYGADKEFPEGIEKFIKSDDTLRQTPSEGYDLAIKALGGCVKLLIDNRIDTQVMSMARFSEYVPPDMVNKNMAQAENSWTGSGSMVLDAITLRNLRVVEEEGCLYNRLNYCVTGMGKRLLYKWVCSPSCDLAEIHERQEAVKFLMENPVLLDEIGRCLKLMPDIERLLPRIHALGNPLLSDHPDSRATFYGEKAYSKKSTLDFISIIDGLSYALELVHLCPDVDAALLKKFSRHPPEGIFPEYDSILSVFKTSYDKQEAKKTGRILPKEGVDENYDMTLARIENIKKQLSTLVNQMETKYNCKVSVVGSDKRRFQLEFPDLVGSRLGPEFRLEGTRRKFKRYSTQETRNFLEEIMAEEKKMVDVINRMTRNIFEKFSSHRKLWETVTECISNLDVLQSLAQYANNQSECICLPKVTLNPGQAPYIDVVNGRHPCINVNAFVPNDTSLGGKEPAFMLLTGPNMGGKSTLMRQTALITILAHLGSYVPAEECSLSLVDRVFTRVGASDAILEGQSTFLVEMLETAAIMNHATKHSFVVLDELGSGTSTYDGVGVASGVSEALLYRGCRVLFSTHYHELVDRFASRSDVTIAHMSFIMEEVDSESGNAMRSEDKITFIYKLSRGACQQSYSLNTARLAGMPCSVINVANQVSSQMARQAKAMKSFLKGFDLNSPIK